MNAETYLLLAVVGGVPLALLVYAGLVRFWPYARCWGERWRWPFVAVGMLHGWRCAHGWYHGPGGSRKCRRCRGSGRRLRIGRRVFNTASRVGSGL